MGTSSTADATQPAADGAGKPFRIDLALKIGVAAALFVYVFIRIFRLDLTGDELAQPFPLADIFSLVRSAEQLQPLIYILSTISKNIFWFSETTELRLPCLIAFGLYAWGAFAACGLIPKRWLSVLAFVALFAHPFLIDFFSIQRGYCFTVAFTLLSTVSLARMLGAAGKPRDHHRNAAIWWGFFAFISNLAALHYYLCMCVVVVFLSIDPDGFRNGWRQAGYWLRLPGQLIARNQYLLANVLMITLFWLPRIIMSRREGNLYSGGKIGFIHDTIGTLVTTAFYDIRISDQLANGIALGIACFSSLITLHALLRQRENIAFRRTLLVSVILMMFAAGSVIMHTFMDIRFLWGRTALHLVPLFILQIGLYATAVGRAPAQAAAGVLFGFMTVLFVLNANLTHTQGWHMNSQVRKLLRDMAAIHENHPGQLVLGISDPVKPKLDYYKDLMGIDWLVWYPIDMYTRFTGQYQIHPDTAYFFIWQPDGKLVDALKPLPIEKAPYDYPGSRCVLYKVRDDANLRAMIGNPPPPATPSP